MMDYFQLADFLSQQKGHHPGMAPAIAIGQELRDSCQQRWREEISSTHNDASLLGLMATLPLTTPLFIQALVRLAQLVQEHPNSVAKAASIANGVDFLEMKQRLQGLLPQLDALQVRETVCALAALHVHDPRLLFTLCECAAGCLHSFNSIDVARCLWGFCKMGLGHAPAYLRMIRTIERNFSSFSAELVLQLAQAIAPLGRTAACTRTAAAWGAQALKDVSRRARLCGAPGWRSGGG